MAYDRDTKQSTQINYTLPVSNDNRISEYLNHVALVFCFHLIKNPVSTR